tara:strand:+ start:6470 stop:6583 length:114 start_codon:yes stop_codon:yes gene_type:complete
VAEGLELHCGRCKTKVLVPRELLISALRGEPDLRGTS